MNLNKKAEYFVDAAAALEQERPCLNLYSKFPNQRSSCGLWSSRHKSEKEYKK